MIQDFTRHEWKTNKEREDEVSQNWSIYFLPEHHHYEPDTGKKTKYYRMCPCRELMSAEYHIDGIKFNSYTSRSVTEGLRLILTETSVTTPESPQFSENRTRGKEQWIWGGGKQQKRRGKEQKFWGGGKQQKRRGTQQK